ncbi:MAG: peptidoglycan DD-metalloendopeptidase family protein [Alphaproteobacteria bacterium]
MRIFPPREFTVMDTPRGNVYSFNQSSFWRFTKFVGKIGLIVWASWSTYVFVYHRPMLQKRTMQLQQERERHDRQLIDLQVYLSKFNDLTHNLNVIDDKILNSKKLSDAEREQLTNSRVKIWGELDFLKTRVSELFADRDYSPEYTKMADLSVAYDMVRAENDTIKQQNEQIIETMAMISEADTEIVNAVTTLTSEHTQELRKQLNKISSTLLSLGIQEQTLIQNANKYSNPIVNTIFTPIKFDAKIDNKYKKLANDLEMWAGLAKLSQVLPLGAPVKNTRVTSSFGIRKDPFTKKPKQHKGIDFAGKIGTELTAVAPGRVISVGERNGYGLTVEVDHGLGFSTLYAHLSKILVSRGDWVRPGSVVGLGGSSGRSTGAHLHYEIKYKGNQFNPSKFVQE